ncbi:cupin domain-containing protein [Paraglaciecola marina]|uniref:cupin domain-containing protein n=1 Tax=Paraglaciecola marina TaxID=2500157 RepID=UPI0010610B14|nr:cupin domain-containing protein [Paraglaciecola marina]
MKIAADFKQRELVHSESLPWLKSPMQGVERRLLERVGDEVARATSIVKYAPKSSFSPHVHTGGEEFIVLEGVFQDEHGDFPAGSYVRNPPQSNHQPGSDEGCIIFVKLWQFQPNDRTHINIQMDNAVSQADVNMPGISVAPLFKDDYEEVSVLHLAPNTAYQQNVVHGAELFVLQGSVVENNDLLRKHSWLRLPVASTINAQAGSEGAKIWIKTGHLSDVNNQIERLQTA